MIVIKRAERWDGRGRVSHVAPLKATHGHFLFISSFHVTFTVLYITDVLSLVLEKEATVE